MPIKMMPKVFRCPRCGRVSVKVTVKKSKEEVVVRCAACDLEHSLDRRPLMQPIDYYSEFVDSYVEKRGL